LTRFWRAFGISGGGVETPPPFGTLLVKALIRGQTDIRTPQGSFLLYLPTPNIMQVVQITWGVARKLALTSPTGGGRSVGMVRSRTKATEFSLV